jgi:hypothetical protein
MLENALARLKHEIQAREVCVFCFELVDDTQGLQVMLKTAEVAHAGIEGVDDAQGLQVMLKTAEVAHAGIEGILAGMPERRVPEIVR